MSELFTIGVLAGKANCSPDTIRYYERRHLLPLVTRSSSGRRLYSEAAVRQVTFIRRARELGFTLEETQALLNLTETSSACGQAAQLIRSHADMVREKIKALKKIEGQLRTLADNCEQCDGCHCAMRGTLARAAGRDRLQ